MPAIEQQIQNHIATQLPGKQADMLALHELILKTIPGTKLWFDEGKNSDGKTVANPTIGYGSYIIDYADGTKREFFKIGMSANATGISVFIMGLNDKTYLQRMYGNTIGKAKVTGYCIRFRKLGDIDAGILQTAIRDRVGG